MLLLVIFIICSYTVERRVRELGPGGTKLFVWQEAPPQGERMGMGPDGQVSA